MFPTFYTENRFPDSKLLLNIASPIFIDFALDEICFFSLLLFPKNPCKFESEPSFMILNFGAYYFFNLGVFFLDVWFVGESCEDLEYVKNSSVNSSNSPSLAFYFRISLSIVLYILMLIIL